MSRLHDALLACIRSLDEGRASVSTSAAELLDLVRAEDPDLRPTIGDVEEAVRHLDQDATHLTILHAEGNCDRLSIRLLTPPTVEHGGPQINISGGAVQVGDYNQMQFNANTYGSVLLELRTKIEQAPLPPAEKRGLLQHITELATNPLLQTLLNLTLGKTGG